MNRNNPIKRIIKYLLSKLENGYLEIRSYYYLNKNSKKAVNKKRIKVGFIVQVPEVWDKEAPIYEYMKASELFRPVLLVLPNANPDGSFDNYGKEYVFFRRKANGKDCIKAVDSERKVLIKDLRSYDYIFFQRPYEIYLPKGMQSVDLIKYSKLCYVPYSTTERESLKPAYTISFLKNMYFCFMDTRDGQEYVKKRTRRNKNRHIEYLGYPVFEQVMSQKAETHPTTVLWTPRWAFDSSLGGSHFFDYKDHINTNEFAGKARIIIRPHPLMFWNIVNKGLMSEEEIESYRSDLEKKNIELDRNVYIQDTFKYTSILISDLSSVIPLFFITGKPIIYCPVKCDYSAILRAIMPGLYIADSWDKVNDYVDMLLSGKDPLKEKRESIIRSYFRHTKGSTERIVNRIAEDHGHKVKQR